MIARHNRATNHAEHSDHHRGNICAASYFSVIVGWNYGSSQTQHRVQGKWCSRSKPLACVAVTYIRTVPQEGGARLSAFVVVGSRRLPVMSLAVWWQQSGLGSARRKPASGSAL